MILNSIVKMVRGLIGLDNLSGRLPLPKWQDKARKWVGKLYFLYGANECKFRDIKLIANPNA